MPTRLLLDGASLDALLQRVRAEMGPGAQIVKAERVRTGGIGGFFTKEHYELTIEVPDPPAGAQAGDAQKLGAEGMGLAALLSAADAVDDLDIAADPGDGGPVVSTDGEVFAAVLESIQGITRDTERPAAAGPRAAPASPPADREPVPAVFQPIVLPRATATTVIRSGSPGPTGDDLLDLGLPQHLVPEQTGPVKLSEVVAAITRPPALSRQAGTVVAVVGEAEACYTTCVEMARHLRQDPADIALAGDSLPLPGHGRRLQTAAAAARFAKRAALRDAVVLVAVAAPFTRRRSDLVEVTELLTAMAADQVWAVVDARRKVKDLRAWVDRVRGPVTVDAVAVTGMAETDEPGSVLDLPAPVGWIDGLPATPVVWAALLDEHLADHPPWD